MDNFVVTSSQFAWIIGLLLAILLASMRLLWMHMHADHFGFGTGGLREVIEANTKALEGLQHWLELRDAEHRTRAHTSRVGD